MTVGLVPPIVPVTRRDRWPGVPPIVPLEKPCANMASLAELTMLSSPEAVEDVVRRLRELGMVGAQSIACIAPDGIELRRVAANILDDSFGNGAWLALHAVWVARLIAGSSGRIQLPAGML